MTEMNLIVRFGEESLQVTAKAELQGAVKSFRFALSERMTVSAVRLNGEAVKWTDAGEAKIPFCMPCRWYEAESESEIRTAEIEYSGLPVGWLNTMNDSVRAFSGYSGWYPQEGSLGEPSGTMTVLDSADWFMIKGVWSEEAGTWVYDGATYDPYNLIMYRKDKLHVARSAYLNIYCVDEDMLDAADAYASIYSDVLAYYNGGLYPACEIKPLDMPCLFPASKEDGAYFRKELIVLSKIDRDPLHAAAVNAHELAHQWCQGANVSSWEDWLNETTAEWSALLYARKKDDSALFDYILKPHLKIAPNFPAIRTADGSRPEGVHTKGTVLFYRIYQQYGAAAVESILRLFASLEVKTTANLLSAIRESISPEIAKMIENALDEA